MAKSIHLLNILNNLILSTAEDMVQISKATLVDISMNLQQAHETIEFLQLESQLQRDELQQKSDASKSFNYTDEDKDVNSKSLIQTTSSVEVVHDQIELVSSKQIIKPWEELQCNKNRRGLGYDKDENNLHILDYSKPIKFISARFLDQITSTSHEKVEAKPTCKHFQRKGHMEDHCFDLHPCHHCGKKNHSSERCYKPNQLARLKINYV